MASKLELPNIDELSEHSLKSEIVRSVEQLQLPPEKAVIVGSAALFLYGVRLPVILGDLSSQSSRISASLLDGGHINFETVETQPHDIDIAIDATTHYELLERGATPSGQVATYDQNHANNQDIFRVDSSPLPIDLISRLNRSGMSVSEYDRDFNKHYIAKKRSAAIPGSSVRVATPEALRRELRKAKGESKPLQDLAALDKHERTLRKRR